MFSADTHRYSPYGPSSRLFLNALYIDPAAVAIRHALARTQSALFDARTAMYALRDDYRPQPGRFTQLRAAIMRYRAARTAYATAAAAFHASPAGAALQAARAKYPRF